MNYYALSSLICGTFAFVLAIFSILVGRKRVHLLSFLFNLCVGIWGVGHYFAAVSNDSYSAIYAFKWAFLGGFFIAPAFHDLVCSMLGKVSRFSWLFYIQAIIFSALNFSSLLIDDTHQLFGLYFIQPTSLLTLAVLIYGVIVISAFAGLLKDWHSHRGLKKVHAAYIFWGFLLGFAGGSSLLAPIFYVPLYPIGNLGIFAYATVLMFALLRDKIFDPEELAVTVQRNKLAAIGTLATSINHEIRNPLYVIQGLADSHLANVSEGIYKTTDEVVEKANDILKRTGEQATRAMEIMKRFAVFAKQSAGEKPQTEAVNLNRLVDEILPLVRHELELDKIRFERQIPEGLASVVADKRQLEEILFNLIVNSCQAMKTAGGEISLSAEQQNGHVSICVKDTGPGIPAQQLKQIFEPFYTTKQEGTGLGLYITKQLVERNGGKIKVASVPDKGTSFEVQLKAFA